MRSIAILDPLHELIGHLDTGVFIALWSVVSSPGVVESIGRGVLP